MARSFVELLSPLVEPNEDDLDRGLQLFTAHEDVGAFDAVLAAVTMGREHLRGLMSTDRAFAGIPGLRHIDPADPAALGALLAD